jgi:hypothetical protein
MEQQALHMRAIKSLHDYFKENKWESGPFQGVAARSVPPPMSPSAAILEQMRPKSSSHAGSARVMATNRSRPQSSLGEMSRPRWT